MLTFGSTFVNRFSSSDAIQVAHLNTFLLELSLVAKKPVELFLLLTIGSHDWNVSQIASKVLLGGGSCHFEYQITRQHIQGTDISLSFDLHIPSTSLIRNKLILEGRHLQTGIRPMIERVIEIYLC